MNKIPFCDLCGSILEIKNKEGELYGSCSCGFEKKITEEISFPEIAERPLKGEGALRDIETPGFPHICEKCGYDECDVTEYGPFYSDESSIILYKCKKCKYTERQADGTGNN